MRGLVIERRASSLTIERRTCRLEIRRAGVAPSAGTPPPDPVPPGAMDFSEPNQSGLIALLIQEI